MTNQHSDAATRHSILRWWEKRGEPVVRHALQGGFFEEDDKNTLTWKDFHATYTKDAVYQDAFIVTPPDIMAVRQSFVLIGSFWDVRVDSLGPAHVLDTTTPSSAATIRVPYSISQRAKMLSWLPWWHQYSGYLDLSLTQQSERTENNTKCFTNWKIKEHEDRMALTLPWNRENATNVTHFLVSVPLFGSVFQSFREWHGKAVHMLATQSKRP